MRTWGRFIGAQVRDQGLLAPTAGGQAVPVDALAALCNGPSCFFDTV
jgi:hypothetical protein